jgi:uncharacterized protein YkwD
VRAIRRALLVLGVALCVAAPARAAVVGDCVADPAWPVARPDLAASVVALVNDHRVALGLAPLATSPTLTAAATWKARHLAAYGYFAHDDPSPPVARTAAERVAACGYPSPYVGENIAAGQPTPADVMASWLGSPGHRENLERPGFRAIGVGVAATGTTLSWVQDFGDVADAGSVAPVAAPAAPVAAAAPAPALAPAAAPTPAPRLRARCRAGQRIVRCRVRLSRPARVRAALRRRGRTYATARAPAARAVSLRLRAHRRLRAGRYTVTIAAVGRTQRHVVRVR